MPDWSNQVEYDDDLDLQNDRLYLTYRGQRVAEFYSLTLLHEVQDKMNEVAAE